MRKTLSILLIIIFILIFIPNINNAQEKPVTSVEEIYGIREDGFSFKLNGKLKIGDDDLKDFEEYDAENIKYPVVMEDVTVLFPLNNLVQIQTGFLLQTTLSWEDVKIISADKKYTINTSKLKRISYKKYVKDFDYFNKIFADNILEKMAPIARKDNLEAYIYQFDGKNLVYIRKTKVPKELKDKFDVESIYATIKNIDKKEVAIFFPYERIMYLTSGYKIYLTHDFIEDFDNQSNERRIYFITSPSLKKKAEELFLLNLKVKFDNLWKATRLYKTIGSSQQQLTPSKIPSVPTELK